MRIVIDLQGAQTESRFRGIGRYSLSLAKALTENSGGHEIILALSGLFSDTIEPIRSEFYDILPQENIRVWYAPKSVKESEQGNDCRREVAELIRESFLAGLQPDVVLVSSLFEGYVDDAVTSIGLFDDKITTAVILYDLIPYTDPKTYFEPLPFYKKYYLRKIEHLKRADMYLAISEYTAKEAANMLDLDQKNIFNISAACNSAFKKIDVTPSEKNTLLRKLGIRKDFIMYVGGADDRKNLNRLINAFAMLPDNLRKKHKMVFAGRIPDGNIKELRQISDKAGLTSNEIVFTGFITDDELVRLYNLCKLSVFPSLHEGFGLPALEAMACGAPVIGSNTTSIPKIIGRRNALFNPESIQSIASKMEDVLTNDAFREKLKKHGLNQSKNFSWDKSAKTAIRALESLCAEARQKSVLIENIGDKLKLAYFSPLPPEKSGISSYSAELLPYLAKFYNIEVVTRRTKTGDNHIKEIFIIRDIEYFKKHSNEYSRILYHFGNSPFHTHMFDLLKEFPGVVVLHDFYLSSMINYMQHYERIDNFFSEELYDSHGYSALKYLADFGAEKTVWKYPCNLGVLQNATGLIVHSEFSRKLAKKWFDNETENWVVISHLRSTDHSVDRNMARQALGLRDEDFIVSSFGLIDPTKLNRRILDAFAGSSLVEEENTKLFFVGENHGGEYGQEISAAIKRFELEYKVRITGWVDNDVFKTHLAVCDAAVQLRTLSRGETSRTVLDCMSFGIPTIVNANGSISEIPKDVCLMLKDEFSDDDLIAAIEKLHRDKKKRNDLSRKAKAYVKEFCSPEVIAVQYRNAIEKFYQRPGQLDLIRQVSDQLIKCNIEEDPSMVELMPISNSIALNAPPKPRLKQLFVDVSAIAINDLKTGIERVTRSITKEWLLNPPAGYRIEPVYATANSEGYHYANKFALNMLSCPINVLSDELIDYQPGDIFLGLDFTHIVSGQSAYLKRLYEYGVKVYFVVYDLLPIQLSNFFPSGTDETHQAWLEIISMFNGIVCISKTTADTFKKWFNNVAIKKQRQLRIDWFHIGADVESPSSTLGMPDDAQKTLSIISSRPSFLMVGTIEPRKGHLQTVKAFEKLWSDKIDVNLVIVGYEGWKGLPQEKRRTIPKIINTLRSHNEFNKRLFWLEGISDEYLEKIYSASVCLIAASEGEGFGLPLIEAAHYKLPVIARDIPVFREVAGKYVYYFPNSLDHDIMANAVTSWLDRYKNGKHPKSDNMPYLTWKESAERLFDILIHENKHQA